MVPHQPRHDSDQRLTLLLFALVFALAVYFFLISPFFALDDVTIEGHHYLRDYEIVALAGVQEGDRLWLLNVGQVAKKIKSHPRVASADLKRQWPRHLNIRITERVPAVWIADTNGLWTVSQDGYVLGKDEGYESLPVLTGLAGIAEFSHETNRRLPPDVRLAIQMAEVLQKRFPGMISEIHMGNTEEIVVYTRNLSMIILGPPEDLELKASVLESLLGSGDKPGGALSIDLRSPRRPVVKKRSH